jgi:anti-anti-sigma factor
MRIESASSTRTDDPIFTVSVSKRGRHRVVRVGGELDIATRSQVRDACLSGRGNVVVVDMAHATFMDCSGYGGLVAARQMLQASGGSLTLRHQNGQPAQLLKMFVHLHSPN